MEKQIQDLVSDREKFNAFIYTPADEAIKELERRQKAGFQEKIEKYLPAGVPEFFNDKEKHTVIFRQLATPNYESRRFIHITEAFENFVPVFFEYLEDKYTDNNEWKYHLGKMLFYGGKGKKGGEKISGLNVIEFNTSRGKKIDTLKTLWGQNLVDFHHGVIL